MTTTKYFITNPSGFFVNWYSDILGLGTAGQSLQAFGGIGDDDVYVGPGTLVDATGLTSTSGSDSIYLTGKFADYQQSNAGPRYTLSREVTIGEKTFTESVEFVVSNSDRVYFSDGYIDIGFGDLAGFPALSSDMLDGSETTPENPLATVPAVQGDDATKVFITDSTGENVAAGIRGSVFSVAGSIGDDTVYVAEGTVVDATGLTSTSGNDAVYLTGKFADYQQSNAGPRYTLSREISIEGETYNESVEFVVSNNDRIYFADGFIDIGFGNLAGFPALDSSMLDTSETTPTANQPPTAHKTTPVVAVDTNSDGVKDDDITLRFSEPVDVSKITLANLGDVFGSSAAIEAVDPDTGDAINPVPAYADTFKITTSADKTFKLGDNISIGAAFVVDEKGLAAEATITFDTTAFVNKTPTVTSITDDYTQGPDQVTVSGVSEAVNGEYVRVSSEPSNLINLMQALTGDFDPSEANISNTFNFSKPVYTFTNEAGHAWYLWARTDSGYHLSRLDDTTTWYWESVQSVDDFSSHPADVSSWMQASGNAGPTTGSSSTPVTGIQIDRAAEGTTTDSVTYTITFDRALDDSAPDNLLQAKDIELLDAEGNNIDLTGWTIGPPQMIGSTSEWQFAIQPPASFPDTAVRVRIKADAVKAADGSSNSEFVQVQSSQRFGLEHVELTAVLPDNTNNLDVRSDLVFTMANGTMTLADISQLTLQTEAGTPIAISQDMLSSSAADGNTTVVINLPGDLDFNTTYNLTVGQGAYQASDSSQNASLTISFKTIAPDADGEAALIWNGSAYVTGHTWIDASGNGDADAGLAAPSIDLSGINAMVLLGNDDDATTSIRLNNHSYNQLTGFGDGDHLYIDTAYNQVNTVNDTQVTVIGAAAPTELQFSSSTAASARVDITFADRPETTGLDESQSTVSSLNSGNGTSVLDFGDVLGVEDYQPVIIG